MKKIAVTITKDFLVDTDKAEVTLFDVIHQIKQNINGWDWHDARVEIGKTSNANPLEGAHTGANVIYLE